MRSPWAGIRLEEGTGQPGGRDTGQSHFMDECYALRRGVRLRGPARLIVLGPVTQGYGYWAGPCGLELHGTENKKNIPSRFIQHYNMFLIVIHRTARKNQRFERFDSRFKGQTYKMTVYI